ncbi:MAG: TIGR00730 family Rossman fold protein [Dehalococcoidia bacterium]
MTSLSERRGRATGTGKTIEAGTTSRPAERRFLAGPQSRWDELVSAIRIAWEFVRGFRALHFVGPCVTVFGSSRFKEDHRYYELARQVGQELARAGFTVMTGGGPGIMEAANRGAKDVGGLSVGCNIDLGLKEPPNAYLDRMVVFRQFFVRKVMLVKYSYAFVCMPGGVGTMDEIFEAVTLIQTSKIKDFPLVLMGTEYWEPLVEFMREKMLSEGTIDQADIDRLILTDDPSTAAAIIRDAALRKFGLRYEEERRARRVLGER